MRGSTWLIAAFVAFALPGCQINPAPSEEITLHDDAFRPFVEYATGTTRVSSHLNRFFFKLLARVDRKTGETSTLVSLVIAYEGSHLRKYKSARNARAEALRFYKPTRHRSCEEGWCSFDETLLIEIPQTELRQAPPAGYQLKVFARSGENVLITIPRGVIERLLAKLDNHSPKV
ncbi:MAG: hypothetical protein ACR2OF_04050 [Hyphomicrobium sp.]